MASVEYPFIDIAALDAVRREFAVGAPVVILAPDLHLTIWANGPGASVFGHDDVESMIGADPGMGLLARRQLAGLTGFPDIGQNRLVMLRIESGLNSRAVTFRASHVKLPDGAGAIMLAADPAPSARSPEAKARNAIGGFTRPGHHAAYLDQAGNVIARTSGFETLGLDASELKRLVGEVRDEADRIVKRRVPVAGGHVPAGIVRLTDEPANHLLVVVSETGQHTDESPENEESSAIRSPEPAHQVRWDGESRGSNPVNAEPEQETPVPLPRVEAGGKRIENIRYVPANRDGEFPRPPEEDRAMAPVRFVWKTDADGLIREISEGFITAMGERTGAIMGYSFYDVSTALGLDPRGEIAALLKRRDTWSGRMVLWPVAGTDRQVPVDLAALPVYDRARNFEGFRGFGVARMREMQPDPDRRGMVFPGFGQQAFTTESGYGDGGQRAPDDGGKAQNPPDKRFRAVADNDDPFLGEIPAITFKETPRRRHSDKVIDLTMRRPADRETHSGRNVANTLSDDERSAFREIANRLKKETEVEPRSPLAFGKRRRLAEKPQRDMPGASEPPAEDPATMPADDAGKIAPSLQAGPLARPNPVPSAFSGLAALFRARLADHDVLIQLPVPIMIYNDTRIRFANTAFLKLTGYDGIESLNEAGGVDAIFPDTVHDAGTGAGSEPDHDITIVARDGESIPVDAHLQRLEWEGEKALVLSVRSAGENSGSPAAAAGIESAAQSRVDELVSILDTATDGVVTIALDYTIRSLNRSAEALFGYESADIVGKPFADLFAAESRRTAQDYVSGLSEAGVASLLNDGREVIGRESHGRFIPLFMTVGRLAGSTGYCAVLRDITQWKQAEKELTEARRAAERSSSQKTEFLARISHEIRTPLNAIIGFSELMLDEKFGPVGNERYRDYLNDINRSGNHILDLVNDLLDISKIEAGEMELDHVAVALNDTLAEAIAMIQPQANRERVIVRSSLASGLPDVVADLRSVRQIALNLLSNAIRYTLAGGQVIVSTAYESDGSVVIRVRDTGVGMSQAEINQALKPFRQISALKRKHDRGTGLGLPLTKAMVEANRATFSINSTPGEGTLVEVVFPPTRVLAD